MKTILISLLLMLMLSGCEFTDGSNDTMFITGIRIEGSTSIVNIGLKSGNITSNNIECYVFGSAVFEPKQKYLGYVDCYHDFNLINPESGEIYYSYNLPGMVTQTVIDTSDNILIGQYYENDSIYVIRLNLENGQLLSNNSINFGEGIIACTYFYNPILKEYVFLNSDSSLVSVDPINGDTRRFTKLETIPDFSCYDAINNRLIGVAYSLSEGQIYIVILDAEDGSLMDKVLIKEKSSSYFGCAVEFDPMTNCLLLINSEKEILFIDIATGEIKDSYELGFDVNEFKYWRNI